MNSRAKYQIQSAAQAKALFALEKTFEEISIEKTIKDLVKIRVSQLNGCLFCLDMHSKEAKKHQERDLRLFHLAVWRESELFSSREKAALDWAERLTQIGPHGIEDDVYANFAQTFSEKEISDLTFVVAAINAWNRLGVAFRSKPGSMDRLLGLDKVELR